ncbi:MAG: glycosyltransferase family 2 protein [Methylovulum sp.]|nr:glycosyltransferase family 2 protein [Methylovulum sp.]
MLKKLLRFIQRGGPAFFMARKHRHDLTAVSDRTSRIKRGDLLAFIVLRNETIRIPYFLDYYRALGVGHFLFVDNDSNDGLMDRLAAAADCSVWHTAASYKEAKFGVHWLNYLLRIYGSGHWCLTLDPDEFLDFPHSDSRSLAELTAYLDQEGKASFFAIMLDMYGEGPVDDAGYRSGQNPLDVCPWFDATGYYQDRRPNYGEWWIRGGVRRRVFFPDQPEHAPALNKTVLVKWRWYYAYIASTHIAWPNRLNRPHFSDTLAPTGCLLHFKYLSLLREKVEEEMERKEHYAGSREYQRYLDGLNDSAVLWSPASVRFRGWRQCVDLGLMNVGRWF